MIAQLKGIVEYRNDPYLIIDVHGVGYKVYVTADILSKASPSSEIKLAIFTHVKEDALELYGFPSQNDLKLFEMMIGVSGIGPKTAIGAFSIGTSAAIIEAIQKGNVDYFTSIPRLGKKNAQKLIIELKNKLGSKVELDLSEGGSSNTELISALKSFGFTQEEALAALRSVSDDLKEEEKLKAALKYLGRT